MGNIYSLRKNQVGQLNKTNKIYSDLVSPKEEDSYYIYLYNLIYFYLYNQTPESNLLNKDNNFIYNDVLFEIKNMKDFLFLNYYKNIVINSFNKDFSSLPDEIEVNNIKYPDFYIYTYLKYKDQIVKLMKHEREQIEKANERYYSKNNEFNSFSYQMKIIVDEENPNNPNHTFKDNSNKEEVIISDKIFKNKYQINKEILNAYYSHLTKDCRYKITKQKKNFHCLDRKILEPYEFLNNNTSTRNSSNNTKTYNETATDLSNMSIKKPIIESTVRENKQQDSTLQSNIATPHQVVQSQVKEPFYFNKSKNKANKITSSTMFYLDKEDQDHFVVDKNETYFDYYKLSFENITCALNKGILYDPVSCINDSSHKFCYNCIFEYLKNNKSCPIDCSFLNLKDLVFEKELNNIINQLDCVCINNNKGCEFKGSVFEYKLHIESEDCLFKTLLCREYDGIFEEDNFCKFSILSKDRELFKEHKETCLESYDNCKYCGITLQRKYLMLDKNNTNYNINSDVSTKRDNIVNQADNNLDSDLMNNKDSYDDINYINTNPRSNIKKKKIDYFKNKKLRNYKYTSHYGICSLFEIECELCHDKIIRKEYENHVLYDCKNAFVRCENTGCSVYGYSNELAENHYNKCHFKPIKCAICLEEIPECDFDFHTYRECGKAVVKCGNNGCEAKILRDNLFKHTHYDCLFEVVECQYRKIGCPEYIIRKDISKHNDDFYELHEILKSKYNKNNNDNNTNEYPSCRELNNESKKKIESYLDNNEDSYICDNYNKENRNKHISKEFLIESNMDLNIIDNYCKEYEENNININEFPSENEVIGDNDAYSFYDKCINSADQNIQDTKKNIYEVNEKNNNPYEEIFNCDNILGMNDANNYSDNMKYNNQDIIGEVYKNEIISKSIIINQDNSSKNDIILKKTVDINKNLNNTTKLSVDSSFSTDGKRRKNMKLNLNNENLEVNSYVNNSNEDNLEDKRKVSQDFVILDKTDAMILDENMLK